MKFIFYLKNANEDYYEFLTMDVMKDWEKQKFIQIFKLFAPPPRSDDEVEEGRF
jgi:hypothetical protein